MNASLPPELTITQLSKRYPNGVLANDAVSLRVAPGRVHAIVGENGAGKSTLLKMLYGLEQPDSGRIELDGRPRQFRHPADAIAAGIGLVPQHLQLLPSMTVAENIVLGNEPLLGPFIDTRAARREVQDLCATYGLAVRADAVVGTLSAGEQQRVEILKALSRGARLLLLDEPSALLTPQETAALFAAVRALVRRQMTVLLITHKMAEVREVCDSFTVMRGGRVVGEGRGADFSEPAMAELIVGRPVAALSVPRVDARGRKPCVQVRALGLLGSKGRPELHDVSLDIAPGEILGVAGVEGNGQDKLADILSGMCTPTQGSASLDAMPFTGAGPQHARRAGVGCIPEDRLRSGVALGLSIAENTMALDYAQPPQSHLGRLQLAAIAARARSLIQRFGVRAASEAVAIGTLSGGNMQKLVVARELQAQPRLLIAAQPTRGVDVGAAQGLRQALVSMRDAGGAVLLLSADLDEVLELADRIVVMFEGRIVAHFRAGQADRMTLGRYMTGLACDVSASGLLGAATTAQVAA